MAAQNLRRFVTVRDIPGIASKELAAVSKGSCDALRAVGTDQVQWVHSYVTKDRQAGKLESGPGKNALH